MSANKHWLASSPVRICLGASIVVLHRVGAVSGLKYSFSALVSNYS